MPAPDRFYEAVNELIDRYRRFEDDVADVIDDIELESRRAQRNLRRLAADIDREAQRLADDARTFLTDQLTQVWYAGATRHRVGRFQWAGAHQTALGLLIDDTFTEILQATRHMSGDVKAVVRSLSRERSFAKVGSGTPVKAAGRDMAHRLKDVGITAVTYSDGRHIKASTYAEMVLRTKTAVAYNLGALNQYRTHGIRYVECIDGADCGLITHRDGDKPNGRILPVDVAATYPLSHPNCRRDFVPRPDIVSDDEAMVATSWRSEEQRSDQANFERYLLAQQQATTSRREPRSGRAAARSPRTPRGTA